MERHQIAAEVARERELVSGPVPPSPPTRDAWGHVRPNPLVGLPAEGWRRVCVRLRLTNDPEAELWAKEIERQCGLGS